MPSPIYMDPDGRAQKRRGSAVDTNRISQLSLYDRRNSVDSRLLGGPAGHHNSPLWLNERRNSMSSFTNGGGGYSSAFTGTHPRAHAPSTPSSMATFAWSAAQQPDSQEEPHSHRPFDSQPPHSMSMMPPLTFPPDRRMSVPENSLSGPGPTRSLRSRSRPPSRQLREPIHHPGSSTLPAATAEEPPSEPTSSTTPNTASTSTASASKSNKDSGTTPYSRSPELRVSHKLAERKRRKEMKDLFDELRDQLPADRGMKASKWEILSKAIDFVVNLKQSHQEMLREIEMLRHELEGFRQGIPSYATGAPPPSMVYASAPVVHSHYPPPPTAQPPHPHQPPMPPQSNMSRPPSSDTGFAPGIPSSGPGNGVPNGKNSMSGRSEAPPS